MSTFNGIVTEFPDIRIDYFRAIPGQAPPLACFLSHVHTDHLQGLESIRSPFIYCSHATRELLLNHEKYFHRMNLAKGVLETRVCTYKHLEKLLRPLPLGTPSTVELTPNRRIRVTLFDANHCPGSVMFLIEGDNKSILYTGDIRAEPAWLDRLIGHPVLIPYTEGKRTLDCIYLDNTHAKNDRPHEEFTTKCCGIAELLEKVDQYPAGTIFHFDAWTLGYEEVWLALSAALNTKIHVDRYRLGLYRSLLNNPNCLEANPLVGFQLGNQWHEGCLTEDPCQIIHSCERGTPCSTLESHEKVVQIVPVIERSLSNTMIKEEDGGGRFGDLARTHELETLDDASVSRLIEICTNTINDPSKLSQALFMVVRAIRDSQITPDSGGVVLQGAGSLSDLATLNDMSLENFVSVIAQIPENEEERKVASSWNQSSNTWELPDVITFPYARHSSYKELRSFLAKFRPIDVHPCVVEAGQSSTATTMRALFGAQCSSQEFRRDETVLRRPTAQRPARRAPRPVLTGSNSVPITNTRRLGASTSQVNTPSRTTAASWPLRNRGGPQAKSTSLCSEHSMEEKRGIDWHHSDKEGDPQSLGPKRWNGSDGDSIRSGLHPSLQNDKADYVLDWLQS